MCEVGPCVNHAYPHIGAAKLSSFPGCGHLNVCHIPLLRIIWIVRGCAGRLNRHQDIWLTARDICKELELAHLGYQMGCAAEHCFSPGFGWGLVDHLR